MCCSGRVRGRVLFLFCLLPFLVCFGMSSSLSSRLTYISALGIPLRRLGLGLTAVICGSSVGEAVSVISTSVCGEVGLGAGLIVVSGAGIFVVKFVGPSVNVSLLCLRFLEDLDVSLFERVSLISSEVKSLAPWILVGFFDRSSWSIGGVRINDAMGSLRSPILCNILLLRTQVTQGCMAPQSLQGATSSVTSIGSPDGTCTVLLSGLSGNLLLTEVMSMASTDVGHMPVLRNASRIKDFVNDLKVAAFKANMKLFFPIIFPFRSMEFS